MKRFWGGEGRRNGLGKVVKRKEYDFFSGAAWWSKYIDFCRFTADFVF